MTEEFDVERAADELEPKSVEEILRWAFDRFGADIRIACSLGVEDTILVHEAARVGEQLAIRPRVFVLDTGRLHDETLTFAERVRDRYGDAIELDVFSPNAELVQSLVKKQGLLGFRHSIEARKACCHARKVEPLGRALAGARAWITGMRREQSVTRSQLRVVERDDHNGGIVKINPLASFTEAQTWAYARENHVPTHPLHAQGFRSIGCAPCTRAVAEGEDVRAGRWWWEDPQHKECGLHARGGT
jgi:phosphoadenosine phosphosulfate reductase